MHDARHDERGRAGKLKEEFRHLRSGYRSLLHKLDRDTTAYDSRGSLQA